MPPARAALQLVPSVTHDLWKWKGCGLRLFGDKTPALLLVLATGVFTVAGQAIAADNSKATGGHKATAHVTASHTTTHPVSKKHGVPASHSAEVRRSTAAHRAAAKSNARAHSSAAAASPARTASERKGTAGRNRSRRRVSSSKQRLARLHLEPARVQEIQRALASQGYLQSEPTGEWDANTRQAMLRYQAGHGFPPTGLPEAKSLMKLGLGPHPLAPELDRGQVTTANAGVTATVQNVFAVSPDLPAGSPAAPASLGTVVPETK